MGRLRKVSKPASATSLSSGTEEQGSGGSNMLALPGFPVSDSDIIFKKKGRGRPRILNVQTKHQESAEGKLEVLIHPTKMVAVGPGRKDFIKYLSLMVHQNIRHNVCKWKQVPQSVKDKIVKNVLENWRLPDTNVVRRAILDESNRLYRNWRNRLHDHYLAFETKEAALEHVPDDICESDWQILVDYFSGPDFERMSQINKANRAKLLINHTCGQKSFQAISYEARDPETGKEPDMRKLWELTHKRANGEWVDEASKEVNDKVAEKIHMEQRRLQDSGDPLTDIEPETIDAAFRSVVTGKKSQILTGSELVVRSSNYIEIQQLQAALEAQKREAEEARRECNEARSKLAEIESQLVEERQKREEMEGRLLDRQKEMNELNSQVQASIQAALSNFGLPTTEGETSSVNSQRRIAELEAQLHEAEDVITELKKIAELEAQLHEAEDVITELRTELNTGMAEFEKAKKKRVR